MPRTALLSPRSRTLLPERTGGCPERHAVPEVSRFYGIRICIQFKDHAPAHFHAEYGEFQIKVDLADGRVRGRFPRRALRLVLEWYDLHRAELEANWQRAIQGLPVARIAPLE